MQRNSYQQHRSRSSLPIRFKHPETGEYLDGYLVEFSGRKVRVRDWETQTLHEIDQDDFRYE